MDARIAQLIEALRHRGYTDRNDTDESNYDWRQRRWFGPEGISETIFQVVRANVYTRIVLVNPDSTEPFAFFQYTAPTEGSDACPARPKTMFYRNKGFVSDRKSVGGILDSIFQPETVCQEREVA
ncbi:MAG: hypothetical protein Athens041674_180 [Parcubacteria group bacterium Athens0416_74]|nr:MAG: hypothetical protein Athens041674_180 [Parcubacteria group bacterium Athens0416_74]